jgi:hypothetical protein
MDTEVKIVYAIEIGRVSSTKQGLAGDSLEDQGKQIEVTIQRIENVNRCKIVIREQFDFMQSASGELDFQPLLKAVEYCKNPKNKIKYCFIKSIDRATRAGAVMYGFLKTMFTDAGVTIVDTYGVISSETVNTLAHLNVKYKWSEYSPSWTTELLEAERAKAEVRDILTRMIGASIRYVRMGYRVRPAPMGYINQKIETPHGTRVVLASHPKESIWFIRMFELRIQGDLTDEQIVERINTLGFKTRRLRIRDKSNKTRILGYKGERPLTVKDLQRYTRNVIYAGVNAEKWTEGQPIKTKFDGLVTIEMFNKANRGKVTIVEDGDTVRIFKGQPPKWLLKKDWDNPLYPYKKQVLCPLCRKYFLGSAARGRFPTYHCGGIRRGHVYFGRSRKIFHKDIEEFVKNVEFEDGYYLQFRMLALEEWEKREKIVSDDTITHNQRVAQIGQEIQMIKERIKVLESVTAIKLMEADIDKLQNDKLQVIQERDQKEKEELDIILVMKQIKYYIDHFEKLVLVDESDPDYDPIQSGVLFGLIFDVPPTYQELVDGTVKLSPLFKLNDEYKKTKSIAVGGRGIGPRTSFLSGKRSNQ